MIGSLSGAGDLSETRSSLVGSTKPPGGGVTGKILLQMRVCLY